VDLLRGSLAEAQRTEQQLPVAHLRLCLSQVLANSSEPAYQREGHALVLERLAANEPDAYRQSTMRALLAKVLMGKGELRAGPVSF
jgi:hypothetical protein